MSATIKGREIRARLMAIFMALISTFSTGGYELATLAMIRQQFVLLTIFKLFILIDRSGKTTEERIATVLITSMSKQMNKWITGATSYVTWMWSYLTSDLNRSIFLQLRPIIILFKPGFSKILESCPGSHKHTNGYFQQINATAIHPLL